MPILNTTPMLGSALSFPVGLERLGLGMVGFLKVAPISMIFIVALYLPWCRHLESSRGVKPQLYADNLKCVSSDDDDLLEAARFTNRYIRLVGQAHLCCG